MNIENYISKHIDPEGELLSSLNRDANVKLLFPRMLAGHLQGRLLKMFCRMYRPRRVLEIGAYSGYATLCIAEGLEPDALVYTVEINDEMQPFTIPWLEKSPYRDKIRLFWGDINELFPTFAESFDMVYIDGNKRDYSKYYDLVFPSLRPGAVIVADNTLWSGKVVDDNIEPADKQTQGIIEFNEKVRNDDRVEKVILPVRDGLSVIWKK